jgi:hypothetical protein
LHCGIIIYYIAVPQKPKIIKYDNIISSSSRSTPCGL